MAKVVAGFFSFTEITAAAEHRSYNEWHMLDHMPEQYPLPGVVYGQRWVSTPACTAARAVSDPPLAAVHYVTLYLMADPLAVTLREFYARGRELHRLDRFHAHRISHLSGPFAIDEQAAAPRVLVSAEAVPYRPSRGVHVVVGDAPAVGELATVPGVAGAWSFRPEPRAGRQRWNPGDVPITVCWCDADPLGVAAALGAPHPGARFAGPFETIVPWQWDWFDDTTG